MTDYSVFVVETVVRAGVVGALQEAVHFVLIEVYHTDVAVVVLVINVIGAGLAVGGFFLFHDAAPFVMNKRKSLTIISQTWRKCKKKAKNREKFLFLALIKI